MRLDHPIGAWLLLFPGWWALALASKDWPDFRLMLLFAVGAVVMRGAGCVFNDIVDRDLDRHVERTSNRPIAQGLISTRQATIFLLFLLFVGSLILLQLTPTAMILGVSSLSLVIGYPFMKRITYWPQAWLGLTFNWGALMGWVSATDQPIWPALALYCGGIFWTLGYDTIYAHQDRKDDAMIGVKSTALRLGDRTPKWLAGFYAAAFFGFFMAGVIGGLAWPFYVLILLVALHFLWQVTTLEIDDGPNCQTRFKSNRFVGWLLLIAIIAGRL